MGRPKGGINKAWSKEQKYKIILPIINGEISSSQRAKDLMLAPGMIRNWVIAYNNGGIESLENKRKPGINRKELSYTEQLEYENMKLRIENERLKKG